MCYSSFTFYIYLYLHISKVSIIPPRQYQTNKREKTAQLRKKLQNSCIRKEDHSKWHIIPRAKKKQH